VLDPEQESSHGKLDRHLKTGTWIARLTHWYQCRPRMGVQGIVPKVF
jgi:hypothetical protein